MAVNEFLPFAYLTNANVISSPEYQAASWRPGGFVQGTAISPHLNKVWKQGSFMAASLGEFVMNATGEDVRDDGDVAGMANRIANAIRATAGAGGPTGVPNAPGMDNQLYGLRNQQWTIIPAGGGITDVGVDNVFYGRRNQAWEPGVSAADLNTRLSSYLPLTGGQMVGPNNIILAVPPSHPMHPVNQGYLEERLSSLSLGGGGGIPEAGPGGPYGRTGTGGGAWVNLDGRYMRLDQLYFEPLIRIQGRIPQGPSVEFRQLEKAEDDGGLWRIQVGNAGNWNVQRHAGAGPFDYENEFSIGWETKGVYAIRGGFVTGEAITGAAGVVPMPGSFQAYNSVPTGSPGNSAFPELILGNLSTVNPPTGEGYPRYGKWRIAVGGNGNMVFQQNANWSGDFAEYHQMFAIRTSDWMTEVYGSLQVDNDLILGRITVGDAWIARPDIPGYRNLYFGVAGGAPLDSLNLRSNYTIIGGYTQIGGDLQINGWTHTSQGAHIDGIFPGQSAGLYVQYGAEFRDWVYFLNYTYFRGSPQNVFWRGDGGSDPVLIQANYPAHARIAYDVPGTCLWTMGVISSGNFQLTAESTGTVPIACQPGGYTHIGYSLGVGGRLDCYNYIHCEGSVHAGYDMAAEHDIVANNNLYVNYGGITVWRGGIYAAGNVQAGQALVCSNNCEVHGGRLWVANSVNAWTSGGGELHGQWHCWWFEAHGDITVDNQLYVQGNIFCDNLYGRWGSTVNAWHHFAGRAGGCLWSTWGHVDTWGAYQNGDVNFYHNIWAANFWGQSDERQKRNIHDHPFSALPAVRQVKFYDFDRIDQRGRTVDHEDIGFVAQQLRTAMPEVVIEKPEMQFGVTPDASGVCEFQFGEPRLSISVFPMLAYLVKAVQELAEKIETLEAKGG